MAFSNSRTRTERMGRRTVVYGTFTNGTSVDTGGDVNTGLNRVEMFHAICDGTSVQPGKPVQIDETLPLDDGDVTIVTDAGYDGVWEAKGY